MSILQYEDALIHHRDTTRHPHEINELMHLLTKDKIDFDLSCFDIVPLWDVVVYLYILKIGDKTELLTCKHYDKENEMYIMASKTLNPYIE